MVSLAQIRTQYPMYDGVSDDQLLAGFYQKKYKDKIGAEEFIDSFSDASADTKARFYQAVGHDAGFFDAAGTALRGAGEKVLGGIETIGTIGTGMLATPASGFAGLFDLATGEGADEAAKTIEGVQQAMTYMPRTQTGQESLQSIASVGEFFQPVSDAFSSAQTGAGQAVEEATGSRVAGGMAAAGVAMLPELLSLLGLGALRPNTKLIQNGRPTEVLQIALDKKGINWDALTPEAKAQFPSEMPSGALPIRTPSAQAGRAVDEGVKADIQAGGRQEGLAGQRVEGGKLKDDPIANEAIGQGWNEGLVQMVNTATPRTRSSMLAMLRKYNKVKKDMSLAATERPTDIVGDAVMARVEYLRKKATNLRRELNVVTDRMKVEPVSLKPVQDKFAELLQTYNIEMPRMGADGKIKFDFEGSDVQLDPLSQRVMDQVTQVLQQTAPNANDLHRLKRQLDGLINYEKGQRFGGMTDASQNFLKGIRSSINDTLKMHDPQNYGRINDELSQILGVFERLEKATPAKVSLLDASANKQIGQELRKLFSNYASRNQLMDALGEMDMLARGDKKGTRVGPYTGDADAVEIPSFDDSLTDLAAFATQLDERFGATAKTSLQGTMEAAANRTAQAATQGAKLTAASMAADKIKDVGAKLGGKTDESASRAMEKLLMQGFGQ